MRGQVWVASAVSAGFVAIASAGNSTDGSCGPTNGYGICTKASHCCRYGWCGNGAYCAQGCNPLYSYNVDSCYPLPVCQSKTYTFGTNGNARLAKKENYKKVDPTNVDFVIDTGELEKTPDGLILTLRKDKIGAKITSTRALHYAKITFEIQTAWSGGVVTAAVLMGDTSEEVDIEFTGNALKAVQSNIFYDYVASGATHQLDGDTSRSFANCKTCNPAIQARRRWGLTSALLDSLDWNQDKVEWAYSKSSQERILRTVTPQQKHIPELPMYAQLSIWPGGASKSSGTRGWAGGLINWNDERFKQSGNEFRFIVKSVTIECYDDYSPNQAYKYIRNKKTNNQLAFKVVELKGYGVSSKATIVSNVEDISSQDTKSGTTAVVGEEGGGETQVVNAAQERGGTVIPFPTNLQSRPPTSSGLKAEAGATKTGGSNSWTSSWTESGSSETSSWSETSSSWATSSSSLHNQAR